MTFQFDTSWKIAQLIKKINKDIKTVLGGYHVTLMYDEISNNGYSEPFDFLVRVKET